MRDFNHTVNVLVKAFFNGTLVHYNCFACAVGNMVADANAYSYKTCIQKKIKWSHIDGDHYYGHDYAIGWYDVVIHGDRTNERVAKEIENTGYTVSELGLIEKCF